MTTTQTELVLVVPEKLNAVEVFTGPQGVEKILADIEAKVSAFIPDTSTAKGRKEIASMAYKVSQSKVILDDLGKNLVADWKSKAALVDTSRKTARDRLDALRDATRKPLDEWEEAEKARVAAEKLAQEIEEAHGAALVENDLFNRARELALKEAELARIEAERVAKEQEAEAARLAKEAAERAEQERLANEERIREEARERAKREAEAAIAEAERKEKEAKESADAERKKGILAKLGKLRDVYTTPNMTAADISALAETYNAQSITVEEYQEFTEEAFNIWRKAGSDLCAQHAAAVDREERAAAKAEADRIAAEKRAEEEKAAAVRAAEEKARQEAARVEAERRAAEAAALAKAEAERKEAERKAADVEHRRAINREAATSLMEASHLTKEQAQNAIACIVGGLVKNVTINY